MRRNSLISLDNSAGIFKNKSIFIKNALYGNLDTIITVRNCIYNCLIYGNWWEFWLINKTSTKCSALIVFEEAKLFKSRLLVCEFAGAKSHQIGGRSLAAFVSNIHLLSRRNALGVHGPKATYVVGCWRRIDILLW